MVRYGEARRVAHQYNDDLTTPYYTLLHLTSTMMTSVPRCARTSRIQLERGGEGGEVGGEVRVMG